MAGKADESWVWGLTPWRGENCVVITLAWFWWLSPKLPRQQRNVSNQCFDLLQLQKNKKKHLSKCDWGNNYLGRSHKCHSNPWIPQHVVESMLLLMTTWMLDAHTYSFFLLLLNICTMEKSQSLSFCSLFFVALIFTAAIRKPLSLRLFVFEVHVALRLSNPSTSISPRVLTVEFISPLSFMKLGRPANTLLVLQPRWESSQACAPPLCVSIFFFHKMLFTYRREIVHGDGMETSQHAF